MKTDTITKDYISDAAVFADVFNYYIHDGKQVIKPEQLEERDPTEIALPYGADGTTVPVQRFRDAQKLCAAMTDAEIMKFQSSLREVLLFIKHSKDGETIALGVGYALETVKEWLGLSEDQPENHH
jgi:hypothetical protein